MIKTGGLLFSTENVPINKVLIRKQRERLSFSGETRKICSKELKLILYICRVVSNGMSLVRDSMEITNKDKVTRNINSMTGKRLCYFSLLS